jgi:hypothetical protein
MSNFKKQLSNKYLFEFNQELDSEKPPILPYTDVNRMAKACSNVSINFAIEQLTLHIEHPTKPGYKRHDILDAIKELKKSLKK